MACGWRPGWWPGQAFGWPNTDPLRRWVQLFADVLGTPIIVPATRETGALGAALCAAVGTGHFPDLGTAFAAMSGDREMIEPRPGAHEAIEGAYETYLSHLRAASTSTG